MKKYQSEVGMGPWRLTYIEGHLIGIEVWKKVGDPPVYHYACLNAPKPRARRKFPKWRPRKRSGQASGAA